VTCLVFEAKGSVEEPVRELRVREGEQAADAGGGRVAAVGGLGDEVGEVVGEEAVGHGCRASPLGGVGRGGGGRSLAGWWLWVSGVEASHLLATAISHIFLLGSSATATLARLWLLSCCHFLLATGAAHGN
jgi:hypothetical protein